MFEQETELEARQSGIVPLLLIVALIVAVVAMTGYFMWQGRQGLTREAATEVVTASLQTQAPAAIDFYTGRVAASVLVHPRDPNYRLLEKAGWVKLGKGKGDTTPVMLTAKGEEQLRQIAGVKKTEEKDGITEYKVPIAERRLVRISNITLQSPNHALVEYSWQWVPNALGEVFEASGPLVQSFSSWDRAALIQKYGADFYHGGPSRTVIALTKTENGWQIAAD